MALLSTPDEIRNSIARLTKGLNEVEDFDPAGVMNRSNIPELTKLRASIDEKLTRTFPQNSADYRRYIKAAELSIGPSIVDCKEANIWHVRQFLRENKALSIALLTQAISALKERLDEILASPSPITTSKTRIPERKVFVVHGHDEGARHAIARFLEQIKFEVIILHEQASQGRTIIEKIEEYDDVGFAVVLLTPDDEGAKEGDPPQPRARQNVVLELGYFIGRLGRGRVCALKRGDIEIPSDFGGVVYSPFDDNGAWRQALAKELQVAGFEVDWNLVMRK